MSTSTTNGLKKCRKITAINKIKEYAIPLTKQEFHWVKNVTG